MIQSTKISSENSELEFLSYSDFECKHGFFTRSFDAKNITLYEKTLCDFFAVKKIALLEQQHTTNIVEVTKQEESYGIADGYYAKRDRNLKIVLGIKTADCVPVIIANDQEIAFLHVGWKGLALGIVQAALKKFSSPVTSVVFGPHACVLNYEVGKDILPTFINSPVIAPHSDLTKCYLNMQQSIQTIIAHAHTVTCYSNMPCTIQNNQFFSVRREGSGTGRNLSFIII